MLTKRMVIACESQSAMGIVKSAGERASSHTTYDGLEPGIFFGDVAGWYDKWPVPIVIISDGPYGLGSYPGDPPTPDHLAEWYEPHIRQWARKATPQTTLWFWNSELGWATVHPTLTLLGWKYRACHVWDKGVEHVAGNANTRTLRKFPIVTEVCVQYVREARFGPDGRSLSMQEWLRQEWSRTGLPFHIANIACEVKNAATRKYLTADHLWYYPPVDAFVRLAEYANRHGDPQGVPYFSLDGKMPLTGDQWSRMRAKFHCEFGINNVWREPPLNGNERIKIRGGSMHLNQKPLRLLELSIKASSDIGDAVWEPFGGLCSVAVAAHRLGRPCYSAEISLEYFNIARKRLAEETCYVRTNA